MNLLPNHIPEISQFAAEVEKVIYLLRADFDRKGRVYPIGEVLLG